MKRRIYPPKLLEQSVLDTFTTVMKGKEVPLFSTKQKAIMFAAALGYFKTERHKVESRGEGIRYDIFQKTLDDGFIDALAIAEKGDLNILSEEREAERLEIFEEYACSGLKEMERFLKRDGDIMDNIINIIEEARSTDSSDEIIDINILKEIIGSE